MTLVRALELLFAFPAALVVSMAIAALVARSGHDSADADGHEPRDDD
jgi:hypothetical protein